MSNLAGTTWVFNDELNFTASYACETSFIAGTVECTAFYFSSNGSARFEINGTYSSVYESIMHWRNDASGISYKTITFLTEPNNFSEGTKADFIIWLEANATKQDDKLISFAGAKLLYNDVRERIDLKAPKANPVFTGTVSLGANTVTGTNSAAIGTENRVAGNNAVATGDANSASGNYSHAEGDNSTARGVCSHAEGYKADASGSYSHAEGSNASASGQAAHAEGESTFASGKYSHAEGNRTVANHKSQHTFGEYNVTDSSSATAANRGNFVEIVGNGTDDDVLSNARALDWNGNEYLAGDVYVNCNTDSTGGQKLLSSYDPILLKTTLEVPKNNYNSLSKVFCMFPALESPLTYEHCYVASYYMSNPTVFAEDPVVKFSGSRFVLEVTLKALAPASTVDITLCKQEAATTDMTLNSGVQYAPLNSPTFTGTPNAPTAANGTNTTQIATTAFVQNAFAANDAMLYKGTVNSNSDLPATHKQGWTYIVAIAGSYVGQTCEVGDMIICNTDGTAADSSHWNVVQTNINGAVTGPASSTADNIAIFDGATGKIIKDSGFTIGKSVPSNAVFTDTNTKVTSAANHYAPVTASGSEISANATGATAEWNIDVVKGITLNTDGKGHITGMSVTSGKIPTNPDTDIKVRQTLYSTSDYRPLLLSYGLSTDTTANVNNVVYRSNSILGNASTGEIVAQELTLGNTTMTEAQLQYLLNLSSASGISF